METNSRDEYSPLDAVLIIFLICFTIINLVRLVLISHLRHLPDVGESRNLFSRETILETSPESRGRALHLSQPENPNVGVSLPLGEDTPKTIRCRRCSSWYSITGTVINSNPACRAVDILTDPNLLFKGQVDKENWKKGDLHRTDFQSGSYGSFSGAVKDNGARTWLSDDTQARLVRSKEFSGEKREKLSRSCAESIRNETNEEVTDIDPTPRGTTLETNNVAICQMETSDLERIRGFDERKPETSASIVRDGSSGKTAVKVCDLKRLLAGHQSKLLTNPVQGDIAGRLKGNVKHKIVARSQETKDGGGKSPE